MKQSSIEWLKERLTVSFGDDILLLLHFFAIAKEMEKEQIINAYEQGEEDGYWHPENGYTNQFKDAEQYYNETFKTNEK